MTNNRPPMTAVTAPETTAKCSHCGQPEWPDERDWLIAHPATLVLLARRGDVRAIEIESLGQRLEEIRVAQGGTLCWSAAATQIKGYMAALVRDVIEAKPEVALRDALVAEYHAAKSDIIVNTRHIDTMTAREAAGMFLKVGGAEGALKVCDQHLGARKYRTMGVQDLIREAVAQVPPEVEA